ncbi:MAG: hypothetical protein ACRC1H_16810, partial [Caldilineaceae bacterium]
MSQRTRGLMMVAIGVVILAALAVILVVSFTQPAAPEVVTAPTSPPVFPTTTPGGPTPVPGTRPAASGGFIPNDPQFGRQWYLPAINAPQYWETMPANLPPVVVAVIDSG